MKKCLTSLLAVILAALLCGCALEINQVPVPDAQGNAQENGQTQEDGQTPAEDSAGAQSQAQPAQPETSGAAQEQSGENSAEPAEPENENSADEPQNLTDEAVVQAYMDQRDVWENRELMEMGAAGSAYELGYAFFDVDLDGVKELAVQLGGGSMQNCTTILYRLDETGTVVRYEAFDGVFSLAVGNLLLAQHEDGTRFYLMHYMLHPAANEYWEYWAKLEYQPEKDAYSEYVRFTSVETILDDGTEEYTFYIGNAQKDAAAYNEAYMVYMGALTVDYPEYLLVSGADWLSMDEAAQSQALLDSLRA